MHSVASSLMGRPEAALKDLANPVIGTNFEFTNVASAGLGPFGQVAGGAGEIQEHRVRRHLTADRYASHPAGGRDQASLEVKDYSGAAQRSSDLDVVGVPNEMKPSVSVLRGRLAEALGHDKDALDDYKKATDPTIGLRQRKPSCFGSR